ncbi:hypothetical protein SUGI_0629340 [Cryptomeria japonica]|nr:hypothetical protein SUGI_0629340 [Cryptomeria japonica]
MTGCAGARWAGRHFLSSHLVVGKRENPSNAGLSFRQYIIQWNRQFMRERGKVIFCELVRIGSGLDALQFLF